MSARSKQTLLVLSLAMPSHHMLYGGIDDSQLARPWSLELQ